MATLLLCCCKTVFFEQALTYAQKAKVFFSQLDEPHLIESIDQLISACQEANNA